MTNWNNYIMRKYGAGIRNNIFEAQSPFIKATAISKTHKMIVKHLLKEKAELQKKLEELPDNNFFNA